MSFKMIEEVLEAGMVERIDAIEVRMGRLEESVKSFKVGVSSIVEDRDGEAFGAYSCRES